ncbi:hypothetical protein GF352_03420 [archaeon]|nr:hypothetical protein [archaeon]
MGRGRPSKSEIREKITALLDRLQFSYGYEIYKHYQSIFDNATARVIYYHLKKGVELGEFVTVNVERVVGNFSWGAETERVYYALGPFAKTRQEWWKKTADLNLKPNDITYDWGTEIKNQIKILKKEVKKGGGNKKRLINKCNKLLNWCKLKTKNPDLIKQIKNIKSFIK